MAQDSQPVSVKLVMSKSNNGWKIEKTDNLNKIKTI